MPYIQIKAYPKDEKIKAKVAERINEVFLEEWGCAPDAISLSFEEVDPFDWEDQVVKKELEPQKDKLHIFNGKKQY